MSSDVPPNASRLPRNTEWRDILSFFSSVGFLTDAQVAAVRERAAELRPKIGDVLLHRGDLTEPEIAKVLEAQRRGTDWFGEVAVREGVVTSTQLHAALAEQWAMTPHVLGLACRTCNPDPVATLELVEVYLEFVESRLTGAAPEPPDTLAAAAAARVARSPSATQKSSVQNIERTILVAESSRVMRALIRNSLRRAGYGSCRVVEVELGRAAVGAAKDDSPDVVLTDWLFPDLQGSELIGQLRAACPTAAVIVLASDDGTRRSCALAAGAVQLVRKPFRCVDLKAALNDALRARAQAGASDPAP